MSTRYYPLYKRGNPQLRVFLSNFWMKLIKSEEPLPPNIVLFQTSIQMTNYDIKNYLEKIYKIPVVDVKTTIKSGTIKKNRVRLVKDDDYKEALVYLPKDYHFEFPDIRISDNQSELEMYKKLKNNYKQKKRESVPYLPSWFTK